MSIIAVQNPDFQPAMRVITAITNASNAVITTSFAHQYTDGIVGRLYIPLDYGMQQANQLTGTVSVIDATTFSINLDTTLFDPFVYPVNPQQYAQFVPFGEDNANVYSAFRNILPYP